MKLNHVSLVSSCSRIKTAPLHPRLGNAVRCFHSSTRCSTSRDYYQDLEVSPDATKVEIKAKFYELSKKYHPDVAKDDKSRDKFVLVNQAYGELMNDAKRCAVFVLCPFLSTLLSFSVLSEFDSRLRARQSHSQPEPSFVRTRSTSFSNRWRTTPPPSQGPRYPYTPPYARAQQAYEQRQRQQQHDGTHTGHGHGHDPHPGQGQQQHHRPHDHVFETHRMHKYQYYRPPPGQTTAGSYTWSAHDPFSSPWVQRATGKRAAGAESGSASGSGSHGGASGASGDVPPGPGSGRPYGHNPYANDPPGGGGTGATPRGSSARAQQQSAHDAAARASPFGRMVVALGAATLIMGLAQWGAHG
ncbi:DnaJ-domain-containing protein [Coniophora puteana RWD-64-598 SS2]|uniref:DnaJ-domain-containing protein n=1 Tax=Coniophora puteana (strain RWD-64-598) TaxID=741705 RepID=A0A5M3MDE2_CONPW|nr:DnaJ-domain-containing protein [Coniophora puteana RWD-64-598 SS2]EIW77269.1 DnaJ-domain-containing protein [Coniophora puteana RWD-64-598 SS2]